MIEETVAIVLGRKGSSGISEKNTMNIFVYLVILKMKNMWRISLDLLLNYHKLMLLDYLLKNG